MLVEVRTDRAAPLLGFGHFALEWPHGFTLIYMMLHMHNAATSYLTSMPLAPCRVETAERSAPRTDTDHGRAFHFLAFYNNTQE